jgi:hypothetical protein
MPVTITAGITFSGGGITTSFAPPSGATASWYAKQSGSTITRITYATDTATSTNRGPQARDQNGYAAGTGTLTQGWFGGGYNVPAPGPYIASSYVQRITFATDTDTASTRGPLSVSTKTLGAVSDTTTYGWFFGGQSNSPQDMYSTVSRITYATDTNTASARGTLERSAYYLAGTGTTTSGWICGGRNNVVVPAANYSAVSRITYATDTATASARGSLTTTAAGAAATGDGTTYGWVTVGDGGSSIINRITYANDTATASVRGPMTGSTYGGAGTGNNTYGYFAPIFLGQSTVSRITFATDTNTATAVGPTSATGFGGGGVSGIQ